MTNTTHEPPRFKHDCDACKYLGQIQTSQGPFDLYWCVVKSQPVGRSGHSRFDAFTTMSEPIKAEARRRAIEAGYLPSEDYVQTAVHWAEAKEALEQRHSAERREMAERHEQERLEFHERRSAAIAQAEAAQKKEAG